MKSHLRRSGALLLLAALAPHASAQQEVDVQALIRRIDALEQQVAELRRQAGIQTAVETVARELSNRKPRFQRMRIEPPKPIGPPSPGMSSDAAAADLAHEESGRPPGFGDPRARPAEVDLPACRIQGIEVKQSELAELRRFARSFVLGSEQAVTEHVVRNVLIPRCLAEAATGEGVAALVQKAEDLRAAVTTGGRDFAAVAQESSEDAATKAKGGSMEPLQRSAQPMALAQACFETPIGEVSQVVRSARGLHVVLVERKAKADPQDPSSPLVVHARQILLGWKPTDADNGVPRVDLYDASLRDAFPSNAVITDRSSELDAIPRQDLDDDGTRQIHEDMRKSSDGGNVDADEAAAAAKKKKG